MLKDAWTLAIEALSWIELQNLNEKVALKKTAKQLKIEDLSAMGLAYRLVFETIKRKNYLDSLINCVLKPQTIDDFNLGVRAFLRLFVYKTRIECKGDVYKEAVEIARMGRSILGWRTLKPVEKALGTLLSLNSAEVFQKLNDEEKIALQTCHPAWFVKYCFKILGRNEALKFLESSQRLPSAYILVNTLKASEEKAIETLKNEGIRLEKVQGLSHAYKIIEAKQPMARIKSFRDGLFFVQDKTETVAVEIAAPKPGMIVFDVGAAFGTKTIHLVMLMQNTGVIYSLDYSSYRIRLWKHRVTLVGVKNTVPIVLDACKTLPFNQTADLVILNPPCTGTGVFARKPSTKWRLTPQSIFKMAEFQWQMLQNCAEIVKHGGCLVYFTKSICVEENEMQIERFLRVHPEFRLLETKPRVGFAGLRGLVKCQRFYPHVHECDGAFIAKLQKET